MESQKQYKVEGMMCNRCTSHVQKIVSETDDVKSCSVQLETPQLTVEFVDGLSQRDQEIAESSFLDILNAEGYLTEPLSA